MPRANRIDIANGLHHVTQRGLEQRNIVLNEDDRSHWWRLFTQVAIRCRWRVFAVALLDNHYHIYLRTPDPNLSEGMRDLNGGYAAAEGVLHPGGIPESSRWLRSKAMTPPDDVPISRGLRSPGRDGRIKPGAEAPGYGA